MDGAIPRDQTPVPFGIPLGELPIQLGILLGEEPIEIVEDEFGVESHGIVATRQMRICVSDTNY